MEKRLTSPEKGFYKTIKRSSIQITIVKKKKPTDIYLDGRLADSRSLFCEVSCQKRSSNNKNKKAKTYPLTIYPLALSTTQRTSYKPCTKYLFRNYLIDYSAAFVEILSVKSRSDLRCYSYNSFCSIMETNMGRFAQKPCAS